ncbi:hypothetical protein C0992_005429 [Termitomyces sp. T32_za158]|nr:hypothetical protein C0992_005429 [Termitomyces sp. T32_za158]
MSHTALYSTPVSIPLGIVIGLVASFVQSLGLTIQRKSHVINQLLPEQQQRVEHQRPLWLLGFIIFISSNVIGSLVQIASLPVVILAPLGAVSLLWNAFFARFILNEVFSPWMILGTILIAGGAVLIAFFGIVPEQTRSLEDLLVLFSRPAFVTHVADFALSRGVSQSKFPSLSSSSDTHSAHALIPSRRAGVLSTSLPPPSPITDANISTERTPLLDPSKHSPASSLYHDPDPRSINRTRILLAISYSSFSGIISGMCLLFAKSGVELLLLTLQGQNQFWRWQSWILVLGLVVFALLQLWYLHKALILADPTLFSLISSLHLGLVALGTTILLGGVWIVSVQSGVKEQDIETWSESDELDVDETCTVNERALDVEEVAHIPSRSEIHSIPMERGTRSESDIPDFTRVDNFAQESLRPGPCHYLSRERITSIPPCSRVSHRRRTTIDVAGASTSHRCPPMLPINTLGTGFQIGLSPVSPGFAIQPQGRRVSGRGLVMVNATCNQERQRRRTVSEGDLRKVRSRPAEGGNTDEEAGPGQGVASHREGKGKWSWLRYVIQL